jgi:hypothetical protein
MLSGWADDEEVFMALTGDYYVGQYEGHTVELIRNNWNKSLKLLIDGDEVARASCTFPGRRTLAGSLECNGVRHAVVATSVPYRLVLTKDTVEVDGSELPLTYQRPRGLFQALYKEAGEGDLVSVITVSAIALSVSSLLVVAVGVWWLR